MPILLHIDGSLVVYRPQGSNFLALVQAELGDAGTPADGFDSAINAVMALFPSTDQGLADLDATLGDLDTANAAFPDWHTLCKTLRCPTKTGGTGLPPILSLPCSFPDFTQGVPMIQNFAENLQLVSPTPLILPGLPAPPGAPPPAPTEPPIVCVPAPGPAPTPTPTPTPTPPPQPKCPEGWAFVAGKCQPPPVPRPGVPPVPPVIVPPLPAGLPPCPPGSTFLPGIPCQRYPDPEGSITDYVLAIGAEILESATAGIMVGATTAFVEAAMPAFIVAAPVVGAIIAVGALLWHVLGGGCGEACVVDAKIEQTFEAVADNLLQVAKAGMVSGPAAHVGMQHFKLVGMQVEARVFGAGNSSGYYNLQMVIDAEQAQTYALPNQPTQTLTLAAARKLYVRGPGWYPDSITLASNLTDQFLQGHIENS